MKKLVCCTLLLLLAASSLQSSSENLQMEAQMAGQNENDVRNVLNSMSEETRSKIGAQPYVHYDEPSTGLRFVRAGDKVFVKSNNLGRFFLKASDFWATTISSDSVIFLQDRCPFPPSSRPKQSECPNGAPTCPPKEEAQCDRHLSIAKKFAADGLLTPQKFNCLDKYFKPREPTLSYFCIMNGLRPMLQPEEPPVAPVAPVPPIVSPQLAPNPTYTNIPTPSQQPAQNARPNPPPTQARKTTARRGGLGL